MELHLQVREARKQAGLTQEKLAEQAHVGRRDISRFERGENITMKTFLRIIGAIPNLTDLTIGNIRLRTDGEARESATGDSGAAESGAPDPAPAPPSPREMSLLRTLGQVILELTGGGKQS